MAYHTADRLISAAQEGLHYGEEEAALLRRLREALKGLTVEQVEAAVVAYREVRRDRFDRDRDHG
jgi:hypothetical protein